MRTAIRVAAAAAVAAVAVATAASPAFASASSPAGASRAGHAVFVQTDNTAGNRVVAYDRAADGTLAPAGSYATGGRGGILAGSVVDHTASQGSLTYDPRHGLLYAVNAGSDTISVFTLHGDRLALRQVLGSGGTFPVSVDVHGNLVLQHRMNDAPVFSLEISERKAYTSALVGMRTAELLALVQPGQPLYVLPTVGGGRFCPMGGGVPLKEDGRIFAGIGVSGGTADQDVAIVEAALA